MPPPKTHGTTHTRRKTKSQEETAMKGTNRDTQTEYVSADELASILRVTGKHIRILCRENRIPHLRVGRTYRIPLAQAIEAMRAKG